MIEDLIRDAKAWLRDHERSMHELLELLVVQNSYTANPIGGTRATDMLSRALSISTLEHTSHDSSRYAPAVVFSTHAKGAPALLVGHIDTVFPPGSFEGFWVENGVAHGPGVLDMKGGLVVAAQALLALDAIGVLDRTPIRFAVVGDEEVGSPESQALIRTLSQDAAFGLVFEAGRPRDAVVTRRKGTGSLLATAHGRAAHAGNAGSDGVNAIWALAKFIDAAQAHSDGSRGRSVNVGTVSGGSSKNTVPESAHCEVDLRFTLPGDGEALIAELRTLADSVSRIVPGSKIVVSGGISREPLRPTTKTERLLRDYFDCAREAGLGAEEAPLSGGGSDANTIGSVGLPCLDGLGPRGTGYHTRQEQIELATLLPKAEAVVRLLLRLCTEGCTSNPVPTPRLP